jgi:hypothetical protein
MTNARRLPLDELVLRPGTYFNPQTEIMIVVDDSPEVDHELFSREELDSSEWVVISDEVPLEESKRDELIESFELANQSGGRELSDDEPELDEEDEDDEDDLDEVDDLEYDRE